jgi:hypothetical protein
MTRRPLRLLAAWLLLPAAAPALAQVPPPAPSSFFDFAGALPSPASAASAGTAGATRWIGDEPYENPAIEPGRGLTLGGQLYRISRQDLRTISRDFDQTPLWIDFAGGELRWGAGRLGLAAYAHQPFLRLEDAAFRLTADGGVDPATIQPSTDQREWRAGVAASWPLGRVRVGGAIEYQGVAEEYEVEVQSGGPSTGTTSTDWSGGGVGFQLGARVTLGERPLTRFELGASLQRLAELDLEGEAVTATMAFDTTYAVATTRTAAWAGGATLRWHVSEGFRVLLAGGGRGAQRYEAWGVEAGPATHWRVGGEFHDPRDPWTLRFGFGADVQTGVPESRAGVLAAGIGWKVGGGTQLEVGAEHRTVQRTGEPDSGEDHVVLTVVQDL